jgi:hypothetical protein
MRGLLAVVLVGAFVFAGCAMSNLSPVTGFIYSDVSGPFTAADSSAGFAKVGQSEATSILGWVAQGDCGIDAAAKMAGITKIHHVDVHTFSVLGVWAKVTTTVYGE